ncbi:DDE-type integrase/transposase/recombinase, partial [Campylobacter sp. JMF_10 EL2]|uniref:DDE-type integrase/transposase/recombinase n=1 Tax=Campylobacter sp. JMF_10 EL2 TaxID=2983828 RepID=UPI0022E9FB24
MRLVVPYVSLSQKQSVWESVCESDLSRSSSSQGHDTRSRSQLISEQQNDPELKDLYHKALDENEVSEVPVCYYLKNGVLLRKWRPLDVPADEEWSVKHQIVVPKSYRSEILSIAHETPLAGHLGVNKTYDKILNHFYWPGIRQDVVNFCKSCHTCQLVGKPNQTIPKSPLQPIPAFEEPFSRIIIDCVGPLPKTRSGCEYMLTIMCASTRFPEAIPLRNIKAKTIVKALVKFFTFVGLPKSVQSDQGSNFMSGLFQQVMHELGIKQYRSSAYHPESQGALERFHQTLKNMIRTYCFDTN